MLATERWIYHLVSQLECVKCRCKNDLTLYYHNGRMVNGKECSVQFLKDKIEEIDVWCDECIVGSSLKKNSPGRLRHKEEAANMADILVADQIASKYDVYLTPFGHKTKKQFLQELHKCAFCGEENTVNIYPSMKSFVSSISDIQDMLTAIRTREFVCTSCGIDYVGVYKNEGLHFAKRSFNCTE